MGCCASAESPRPAKPSGSSGGSGSLGEGVKRSGSRREGADKGAGGSRVNNASLYADGASSSADVSRSAPASRSNSSVGPTNQLRRFTLREVSAATGRFKRENELGEGSFGKVYKGVMEDWLGELPPGQKRQLAVKVLDENSFQGFGEWMAEVLLLGRLQHPNLVRLLGYSTDRDEAILVYEFLPNGSLESWLFSTKRKPLTWEARMKIAKDATEGLGYLHAQNIIHRDFKSCNILLDQHYTAKLTDFGMATTGPEADQTHVSTRVMGTMGYLDPKYMETGHLTPKSDIYALGVVFLELLTGRPPTADDGEEAVDDESARLTTWIKPLLSTRRPDLRVIMDPRLQGQYSRVGAHKMLVLAKHCVSEDPAARPQIAEMLKTLRQVAEAASSAEPRGSPQAGASAGQQQQEQHRLNELQEQRQAEEEEASIGGLGPLNSRGGSAETSFKKGIHEDFSFDATRKVFGDVIVPR